MKNVRLPRLLCALLFAALLAVPAAAQVVPAGQKPELRFAAPVVYNAGGVDGYSVAVADLRGDGILDLVVADKWQSIGNPAAEVSVLLGNGDGTFQSAVTYTTGAYEATSVAVGDLRGNGIPDLVVANECLSLNPNGNCTGIGAASVLLGNGDGTFQPAVAYSSGAIDAFSVATGDLRSIGIRDLVVANNCLNGDCPTGSASVLLGNGDGTFQPAVNYGSGGVGSRSVAVADLNGNGIPDLVVASECQTENCETSDGTAGVLLGNGDGTFQSVVTYDSGSPYSNVVAVGDLRSDGIQDLVVASGYGSNVLGVLLGNGDGTFQAPVTYALDGHLGDSVAIGDLNGDGIPDLAVTVSCKNVRDGHCLGANPVSVMLGNGDGTFQAPIQFASGAPGVGTVAIADVNGDGRPDLVVTICQETCDEGQVAVLLNETSYTTKTALTSSPNPSQVNQSVTFTATISATPPVPNGELVTFYNGKSEIGTGTTTSGVASLTTSFPKAGTYTIKASYPGDPFRKKSSATLKQVVNP